MTSMMIWARITTATAGLLLTSVSFGNETLMEGISRLQHDWAHVQYQISDEDEKELAFEQLSQSAEALSRLHPNDAEPLIWEGIILSTYAGAAGGLDALGLVKQARKRYERAIEIDPEAMNGSAYTSLGALYYQVPGWPVGFGDDDDAERYLKMGLALNPDGIDSNYFYADFLAEERRWKQARDYLQRAASAADRPDRPVADQGRRQEIAQLKARIDKKLR